MLILRGFSGGKQPSACTSSTQRQPARGGSPGTQCQYQPSLSSLAFTGICRGKGWQDQFICRRSGTGSTLWRESYCFPQLPGGPAKIQRSKRYRSAETKWSFNRRKRWGCPATGKSVHFSYGTLFSISGWERKPRAYRLPRLQPIPRDAMSSPFWGGLPVTHRWDRRSEVRRRKEARLPLFSLPYFPSFRLHILPLTQDTRFLRFMH